LKTTQSLKIHQIKLKKPSNSLKMSKRIELFEKALNHFKKTYLSLKISLKCHAFLKKRLAFSKNKAPRLLPHCHNSQSTPDTTEFSALAQIPKKKSEHQITQSERKFSQKKHVKYLKSVKEPQIRMGLPNGICRLDQK
jgi:hypothetical protein